MIPALTRFVDALREEGLTVSPAELLDAGHALGIVGPEHRWQVRSALKATLAKDRRAAAVFDRLFDRFFAAPRVPARNVNAGEETSESSGLRGRGSGGAPPPEAKPPKKPQDKESKTGKAPPQQSDISRALRARTNASADLNERQRRKSERPLVNLQPRASRIPSSQTAQTTAPDNPIRRMLATRMTTNEERRIAEEVPRIIDALRLGVGRRLQQTASGRPWLRRALRQSVATGGVPFTIPTRSPKRRHARVVVLADVSFSVARASGLFLWMAASFLKFGRRNRVLLFVDRPVDATESIRRWAARTSSSGAVTASARKPASRRARPGESIAPQKVSFAELVDGLKDLNPDAPSDYGTALHTLLTSPMRPRGRDTVLVILGDGRTNRFDPLPWALEELSRECRATLWLASEPRAQWGVADSALPGYLEYVDVVVEATDLTGLACGLSELIRRL